MLPPQAAGITVELYQFARLVRNGEPAFVTTWGLAGVIANPSAQGIRDHIKDRVDIFLNAWLSVNPKN